MAARSQREDRPLSPASSSAEQRSFRLGAVAGATPGKWIDIWRERMPRVPFELVPITVAEQLSALTGGEVDAALVRLPLDDRGLHVIPLYDEVGVVVASADSHLMAAEELRTEDLAGEVLIVPRDDVLAARVDGTLAPRFAPPETTADAVAIVASGFGIVIMPMSLARAHHRKDVGSRTLRDGPTSTVALAWLRERTTADVETFVGVVRGRTARSSR